MSERADFKQWEFEASYSGVEWGVVEAGDEREAIKLAKAQIEKLGHNCYEEDILIWVADDHTPVGDEFGGDLSDE